MTKKVYTLKKKKETNEYHLFEGDKKENGCSSYSKSICKKMDRIDNNNSFACEDENTARQKCAEIGRSVCGTCVSHLYSSY